MAIYLSRDSNQKATMKERMLKELFSKMLSGSKLAFDSFESKTVGGGEKRSPSYMMRKF
ncbi:MAG: hypothetical protein AB4426_15625 [Xenococcaceae cyanobacterium]